MSDFQLKQYDVLTESDFEKVLISGEPYIGVFINFLPDLSLFYKLMDHIGLEGLKYAVCAGNDCSKMDDAIDMMCVMDKIDNDKETFVYTSWHENQTEDEIIDFARTWPDYDDDFVPLRWIFFYVGSNPEKRQAYEAAIKNCF